MVYFPPEIDREFLLLHIGEEEIFSRYGIPVVSYPFRSPLRPDHNPTCNFYRARNSGKLYMKDWAGHFHGDCFDLVMEIHKVHFYEALRIVAEDFELIRRSGDIIRTERIPLPPPVTITPRTCTIRLKRREWNSQDKRFWGRWDFLADTLKFYHIAPLERVWLNEKLHYTYLKPGEEAYVYHFGAYDYKIYFPYRERIRFLHNNADILQGYLQLPVSGSQLIITKSMKDVMKLYEFSLSAVAPMSETQMLSPEQFEELTERFVHLYSLYDTDKAGISSMQKMKREYGIQPLFFPRSFPKDFTDFYEKYGKEDTRILIENIKDLYNV